MFKVLLTLFVGLLFLLDAALAGAMLLVVLLVGSALNSILHPLRATQAWLRQRRTRPKIRLLN